MKLTTIHKVTIGMAIVGAGVFSLYSFWAYSNQGAASSLVVGVLSLAVGASLVVYLRRFARSVRGPS